MPPCLCLPTPMFRLSAYFNVYFVYLRRMPGYYRKPSVHYESSTFCVALY